MDFTEKSISQGSSHAPSNILSKKVAQDYVLEVNQESHITLTVDQPISLP